MKEKLHWTEDAMLGGKIRCAKLAQASVTEGGWYGGHTWLTNKHIKIVENRWVQRCYTTGQQEPDVKSGWIPHQCGGCKFMAALGNDYGICWNENSELDGCIVFEHGGCVNHSDYLIVE